VDPADPAIRIGSDLSGIQKVTDDHRVRLVHHLPWQVLPERPLLEFAGMFPDERFHHQHGIELGGMYCRCP